MQKNESCRKNTYREETCGKETHKATQKETEKETHKATQKETHKETEKETHKATQKETLKEAYKKTQKERACKDNVLKNDLPYEKFLQYGPEGLTERELIAIILRTGTKEKNALTLAGEVLALARSPREGLLGLYDVTLEELMGIKGIGLVKAVKLKCLTELSMRISRASAKEGLVFNSPHLVAQYFMESLRHRDTECVVLVSLDSRCRMLGERKLSDGNAHMALITPRDIFLEALKMKAVNIVLVHNHPSGDPAPSKADIDLTGNLNELGLMMDIVLLDHIIIGDNRYASFREMGYLKERKQG